MNNRANNDFDELEPRITPQPTVLKNVVDACPDICGTSEASAAGQGQASNTSEKTNGISPFMHKLTQQYECMTPSVPEVSIICDVSEKRPDPSQPPRTPQIQRQEKYESYASWKKDEFPSSMDAKTDSRYSLQLLNKSSSNKSLVPLKSSANISPHHPQNFGERFCESPRKIEYPNQSNKNLVNRDSNSEMLPRQSVENLHFQNYQRNSQENSCFPFPPNKSLDSPSQKRYDGVKSILKSSQLERNEATNSPGSPDFRYQRKSHSQTIQSPRSHISDHPRQSVPRYNRQNDANYDQGTVQDLLMLVKNQNEQIKALQNQVERLLKAHEESLINRESRNNCTRRQNESPQSPNYESVNRNSGTNLISPQKSCNSRGMKIVPSFPTDDTPEMCLRYQNDQMRNAIVEKKVSIGVMTSFEFSVHNNPFVADSDHQINAVLRECGKNVDSTENWRRNIGPGPLENINEDSEGYPSSLWKQSNNNTQLSSNSKRTSVTNENKISSQSGNQCSPLSGDIGGQSIDNNSGNYSKRTPQAPIPAPRKISMNNHNQRKIPVECGQQIEHNEILGNSGFDQIVQRESHDRHYVHDKNQYNRDRGEFFCQPYSRNNEGFPKNLESLNTGVKSMENTDENSLVLNSSELKVNNRPPSPDPSIHVEMREYSSDDENEKSKRAPPVGWTFYKNIVGQVNRILHTIPDTKDSEENGRDHELEMQNEITEQNEEAVDPVKLATLERLKMLGISYAEHSEYTEEHLQKKVTFDSSYCPRLDYQTTLPQSTNTVTESNTSMHMKALALKYLSDEQLADLAVQKQGDGNAMKQKILNSVHGTNMSLATMNYLQRYCLVSGVNSPNAEGKPHMNSIRQKKLKHVVMTKELHAQQMPRHHAFNESPNSQKGPDNILDITTLKQQPKLL